MSFEFHTGDCLDIVPTLTRRPDLTLFSPPYEAARTYGIDFKLEGQEWVDWLKPRILACCRICTGLVAVVVAGRTKNYRWSAVPHLLAADLHRSGMNLRTDVIYHRVGIPGSGGKDWFRNDVEYVICITPPGRLPWSDPLAFGQPCKYRPGGQMSYRRQDGTRKNGVATRGYANGDTKTMNGYKPPAVANPGNVIHLSVGGNRMGDELCHMNEAPFSEQLCERIICSFCRPGGVVLDPMCGSGTTVAVAHRYGRHGIGIDIRESQIDICRQRLERVQPEIFV
jgi:hypothetical protein